MYGEMISVQHIAEHFPADLILGLILVGFSKFAAAGLAKDADVKNSKT